MNITLLKLLCDVCLVSIFFLTKYVLIFMIVFPLFVLNGSFVRCSKFNYFSMITIKATLQKKTLRFLYIWYILERFRARR